MRVVVELHGSLRKYAGDGGDSLEIEVAEGATVAEVVAQAGVPKGGGLERSSERHAGLWR